ncbi:MAG: gephyrin-like molybdotransferase Glp [Nocardioides sp.]|jgi:molybdopterin molybdotransferase
MAEQPALETVEQHLARVLDALEPLEPLNVPLLDALGLEAAIDVRSEVALPGFDNSAMDGYAVIRADVAQASEQSPVTLPVVGEIGAGQADVREIAPGSVAKIMTGAPVPAGCDAVVPYEWTDRGVDQVVIRQAPKPHQHIRPAGEDVALDDLVIEAGTRLGPRHVGLLAAVGKPSVSCRPRPRVVVISTGSELRDAGTELGHDSIFDGNSYLLAAAATAAGAQAYRVGIVPDEPEAFLAALIEQSPRADLILTSGGVSQGDWDVVKAALAPRGVWFGGIAMQPGKPQGFGLVDGVPVLTLPGNPVSAYLSFQMFGLPAIRKLMGRSPYARPLVKAQLTNDISSPAGRRQLVRGEYAEDRTVATVGGYASHLIGDLAHANAIIVVPEDQTLVAAGEMVDVLLLDRDF